MKRMLTVILFFLCSGLFASETEKFQLEIRKIAADFASAYSQAHPGLVSQQGITVLDISDETDDAKKARIGHLVRVSMDEALQKSIVFYLVDRKNMETILNEMQLSLSGLVSSGSAVEAGELSGVACLVSGSVSESGTDFLISLSLTEVSTGVVADTRTITFGKSGLEQVSEELQYSYVAANGIGLSAGPLAYLYNQNPMFNHSVLLFVDTSVKYRINRNIMLSAGILNRVDTTGNFYIYEPDDMSSPPIVLQEDLQPELAALSITPDPGDVGIDDIRAGFQTMSLLHIDFQYTVNFAPWFNVGLKAGIVGSFTPRIEVTYHNLFYKDWDYTSPPPTSENILNDSKPMTYIFETLFGGKFEINPEFFITPRLALNATIGYMLTFPARLWAADSQEERWLFNNNNDHGPADDKYFGFDPSIMPDGSTWVLDLSGLYISLGMSVFF